MEPDALQPHNATRDLLYPPCGIQKRVFSNVFIHSPARSSPNTRRPVIRPGLTEQRAHVTGGPPRSPEAELESVHLCQPWFFPVRME